MPASRTRQHYALLCALALPLVGFTFVADVPENQGMSSSALAALQSWSDAVTANTAVLVLRNDRVLLEHYSGSATSSTRFGLTSAAKSVGMGLLARALGDGAVSLNDPLCGVPGMTLRQAASMTAGFKKGSAENCGSVLMFPPGTDWSYSDGSANVVRDRLRQVYGMDLEPQVDLMLDAIGATNWRWEAAQRFSSGISMNARGMALYGRLWERGGDWDGVQVLPASFVAEASTPANPAFKNDYGLLWWVMHDGPAVFYDHNGYELNPMFPQSAPGDAMIAVGCSRAYILVVPSLGLVAVRGGGDCLSISDGTELSDQTRTFVELALAGVSECSDGVDNDGNGPIDFPADAGCASLGDTVEASAPVVPAIPGPAWAVLAALLLGTAWILRRSRLVPHGGRA
jgi:CubicO group peptidase (beta-lactamase class C family)